MHTHLYISLRASVFLHHPASGKPRGELRSSELHARSRLAQSARQSSAKVRHERAGARALRRQEDHRVHSFWLAL